MKNLKLILSATLLAIIGFTACNDDNERKEAPRMIGDIFVRCKIVQNDTLYAPCYIAYCNRGMKSVEVTSPSLKSITLKNYSTNASIFSNFPDKLTGYKKEKIESGDYNFKAITRQGDTLQFINKLSDKLYSPLKITKFEYKPEYISFKLEWKELKDMDMIKVTLSEKISGVRLFESDYLRPNTTKYSFNRGSMGWKVGNIERGKECVLSVMAYKFEDIGQKSWNALEWQSFDKKEFKWGIEFDI